MCQGIQEGLLKEASCELVFVLIRISVSCWYQQAVIAASPVGVYLPHRTRRLGGGSPGREQPRGALTEAPSGFLPCRLQSIEFVFMVAR